MKTVFALFARDVRRLARNPVALVILVGALVLPSLYAWYCIAANWDPYQNTAGIRVAVANEDQGAQSDVAGHLDVGAQVVGELKDNHQLGWEFVPESEALRGVESGDYYAAIVIPADFSASFASLFTAHHERPRIDYYVNEEMNAVAVKVTDTGANTVDDQINDTFTATVAKAATDVLKGFAGQVKADADEAGGSVAREVAQAAQAIEEVRSSLDGVGAQVDSSLAAADASQQTLDEIEAQLPSVQQALGEVSSALQDARREATGLSSGLSQAVGQATSSLGRAAAQAHAAIGTVAGDILQVQGQVDGMLSDAEALEAQNEALVDDLKGLEDQYPQIADVVALLEAQNAQHRQTIADLRRTSESVKGAADKAISASDSVNAATKDALAAIDQAQQDIAAGALPDLSSGLDAFSSAAAQMAGAVAGLEPALEQAQGLLDALRGTLCEAKGTAVSASSALGSTQDGLTTTVTDLEALNDSATIEKLSTLWGIEPANVAGFMASPVKIDTQTVYAVDNYGSGVAPFYTNLALWVGGFVLIAIIKLEVDPRGMRPFGPTQGYLGRWLLFVVLGVVQALIVCAGDLVMGMQCVSPVAFVAAGAFTSFTYVSLIYALAATFKHIGKALAVVLLIMQIPGSAGMYPIEMMPPAFQMVHPFLPFTYGIEAMRETIAGMYDAHYFIDLGRLALFLPFAFLVGLVVAALPAEPQPAVRPQTRQDRRDGQRRGRGAPRALSPAHRDTGATGHRGVPHEAGGPFRTIRAPLSRAAPVGHSASGRASRAAAGGHVGAACGRERQDRRLVRVRARAGGGLLLPDRHRVRPRQPGPPDAAGRSRRFRAGRPDAPARAPLPPARKGQAGRARREGRPARKGQRGKRRRSPRERGPHDRLRRRPCQRERPARRRRREAVVRNAWRIFKGDVRLVATNAIGLMVAIGLVVVPALYAWFNIAGTWDPYENTGGLKVAVANEDAGYTSSLLPTDVNVGKSVVAALHENDQFDWVFVDEGQAVEGVRSGEYYAALVIPERFSADMMTLFSPDIEHASITYYTNEKENAIALHVTEQGADAVQNKIDRTFAEIVDETGLKTVVNLIDFMNGDGVGTYAAVLSRSLEQSIEGVREAADQAAAFSSLVGSTASLVDATSGLMRGTDGMPGDAQDALSSAQAGTMDLGSALDQATDAIGQALAQAGAGLDGVSDSVDAAFDALAGTSEDAVANLHDAAGEVQGLVDGYTAVRDALAPLAGSDPAIQQAVDQLDRAIAVQESLKERIDQTAERLSQADADAEQQHQQIKDDIAQAKASIDGIDANLAAGLSRQMDRLAAALGSASSSAAALSDSLQAALSRLADASGSLVGQLASAQEALDGAAEALAHSADRLQSVKDRLDEALKGGDVERIREIVGSDPASMAELLAAPVKLDRHAVFPIANNGSSMASFYTVLCLWVGCVILAALMKVGVSDRRVRELHDARPWQLYLGRFGLFAILALLQATLACLGDLFFLKIQCVHPWLFLLAGWVTGFVFCNLVYTLVASFGDVGKAIAVVLLVMQVAGSAASSPSR